MLNGRGGLYVPPHRRGRGSGYIIGLNSLARSGGTDPSNTKSRWKNVDNGGSSSDDHGRRHGGRDAARSANAHGICPRKDTGGRQSNGIGRWANSNRSGTSEKGGSERSFRHSARNYNDRSQAKAIFFGDSFVKLFGLLNEYSDFTPNAPRTIEVQKYKGASAKGLCREGNENRAKILETIDAICRRNKYSGARLQGIANKNQHRPGAAYPRLERLVFCFGNVDIHMSFYYKKHVQRQPLLDEDLRAIAREYVDFVAGLETEGPKGATRTPLTKLIVGVYPSPLRDADVGESLLKYGSLETAEQVAAVNASEDDRSIESRQARVDLFNRALRDRCNYHNRGKMPQDSGHGGILEYWDVREELLTRDGISGRPVVKDAFKDVARLNIHLIHETTVQLWVKKWPWYEALIKNIGGMRNCSHGDNGKVPGMTFLEYLQKTFDDYRKTKPWAKGTHVAEAQGIQLD